ncbi:hypothetical protein M752DRAFT_266903 [Aspergillus phoenicis ATCC 13157]|uniref:Uncharacterized protein n=1 Tax=Aspergillus phoenicis ATCC 13157 TaxID=1353007 RepID=A0A370PHJ8_ASPPH|nr:hypothetical protein M752DRAFT_266903 [Aspergillus phoenicis ATCC 13157]
MLDLPTSSSQQPNMPGLTTGVIAPPAPTLRGPDGLVDLHNDVPPVSGKYLTSSGPPTLKYDGLRKFTNTLKEHLSEGTNILEFSEVTKDDFSVLSSSKARLSYELGIAQTGICAVLFPISYARVVFQQHPADNHLNSTI